MLWRWATLGRKAIAEKVARLRRGLDPTLGPDGRGLGRAKDLCAKRGLGRADDCPEEAQAAAGGDGPPFDLATAHELYAALLGPVETLIRRKRHLMVVPTGPLTSLPFHVLVTKRPARAFPRYGGYRKAAWLLRRHAITTLPSVTSLRALGRLGRRRAPGTKPFVGFADPRFDRPRSGGKKDKAGKRRRLANAGNRALRGYTAYFKGRLADPEKMAGLLPSLPNSAREVRAIAKSLGARRDAIHLGREASETTVKSLSARGRLGRYRVVAFATHALVAGETRLVAEGRSLAEPALALSTPARPSEADDGLLTASEVAQLGLGAEWVVLSACNTAAGEKPGAEALSGLAKAFFYAGARALLVSHWPVDTYAAEYLTTRTFKALRKNRRLGRAEALRRAMLVT